MNIFKRSLFFSRFVFMTFFKIPQIATTTMMMMMMMVLVVVVIMMTMIIIMTKMNKKLKFQMHLQITYTV